MVKHPKLPIRQCPGPISRLRMRSPSILMYPPTSSRCKICLSGTRAISGRVRGPRIRRLSAACGKRFPLLPRRRLRIPFHQPHGVSPLGCDIGWDESGSGASNAHDSIKAVCCSMHGGRYGSQLTNVMVIHSVKLSTTAPYFWPTQRLLSYYCEPRERSVISGNGYALSQRGVEVVVDTIQLGGTGGLFDPPVLIES